MSSKKRLDQRVLKDGLASTIARAQAMIIAGNVLVNDEPQTKAGRLIDDDAKLRLKEPEFKYVSRGALKLKGAFDHFNIDVKDCIAIDVGASTGGFTEVLLEHGVKKVYAVDVGTNQLAWKIRSDERVVWRENYNARHLKKDDFDVTFDLVVMDVSFISIRMILPALQTVTEKGAKYIILFKPQFELDKALVGEGGIVTDQAEARLALDDVINWAKSIGLHSNGVIDSPILGTEGNREYLIYFIKN
jgi:23S rRNA (cytidine1920-2'-O)/16S rRNA (cytidine1409-2'-O)-methyltransferase